MHSAQGQMKIKTKVKRPTEYQNTFANVSFDLRKRSGLKYILQLLNICLIFK